MIKKIFAACAVMLSLNMGTALAQTDAKAKAILDGVTQKVNSLKTLKANFTLKITGGKNGSVNDTKKGTVALKGQKYHVTLSGQEIICDNKTVWTYNADAKEVSITAYNPAEQSLSPAKLLTNGYDKEYRYKYVGTRNVSGKNCDVIELTPIDSKKQVSKTELLVDKASSMIVGGTVWSKNGNKTQYSISNFVPNGAIADSYFTWDSKSHPGVEVNDMR